MFLGEGYVVWLEMFNGPCSGARNRDIRSICANTVCSSQETRRYSTEQLSSASIPGCGARATE